MFCPFNGDCEAFRMSKQHLLPVKSKKITIKNRYFHYFILLQDDAIAMRERVQKDIWSGLYDFPMIEEESFAPLEKLIEHPLLKQIAADILVEKESVVFTHVLTHQKVYAKFWHLKVIDSGSSSKNPAFSTFTFFDEAEIDALPKPILINNYLKEHFF
jgi:A/G-specific adenine glycosylase